MSATTYSVGHSVARRLHVLYDRGLAPPIGGDASIRRLSDGQGTEDDLTGWARYCEAVGETMLAELLRSQLPSGPHLAAQVRMQRASAAGPPALPSGWSSKGTHYSFRGRLVRGYGTPLGEVVMMTRECEPGLDMRDVQLECAQAHLGFVTYIRALVAHNKRRGCVTAAAPAPRDADGLGTVSVGGDVRPEEPPYADGGAR